ncbi:neutral zinc metallopeptidase [Naumannella huperziae]
MTRRPRALAALAAAVGLALILLGFAIRPPAPGPPPDNAPAPEVSIEHDGGRPDGESGGETGSERSAPTLDERLYSAGALPAVDCPRPAVGDTSADGLREFAENAVDRCLMPAWSPALRRVGVRLDRPVIKIVTTAEASSPCGPMSSKNLVLAFYCTDNATIYLFTDGARRYAERADWLPMAVLAHEFGHHVQQATNSWPVDDAASTGALRRTELQAECLAGVWFAEGKDNIRDFTLGPVLGRYVGNETHGSVESRRRWFRAGFESGDPDACRTYTAPADRVG